MKTPFLIALLCTACYCSATNLMDDIAKVRTTQSDCVHSFIAPVSASDLNDSHRLLVHSLPTTTPPHFSGNDNTIAVTCLRNCDIQLYHARDWQYVLIDQDNNKFAFSGWEAEQAGTPTEGKILIPRGTYDILARYKWKDESFSHQCFVIHEQVKISNDTTFNISPDEANIHIQFEPYLPNGEKCKPETRLIHDDYSDEVIEPGNIGDLEFVTSIAYKNGHHIFSSISNWANYWTGAVERDNTHHSDMFINKVSDRFIICSTMCVPKYDFDGSFFVINFEVSTFKDTIVANKPQDYVLYEKHFKQTPYGQRQGLYPGIGFSTFDNSGAISGCRLIANNYILGDNEPCRYYMCNSYEDETSPIMSFVSPQVGDAGFPWLPDEKLLTRDPFVMLEYGDVIHVEKGLWSVEDNTYSITPNPLSQYGYALQPTFNRNPIHTFSAEKMKTISGNSCPIMVTTMQSMFLEDGSIQKSLYFINHIGRNGEYRESDIWSSHGNVKVNGEIIADEDMFINYDWNKHSQSQGLVDITVTNSNVEVDGLPGMNETKIHFDMANDDNTAPTLQMLDFRDAEDNAIDRFSASCDGKLQFYCGDFNEQYIDNEYHTQYFMCNDLSGVEVAYSPYQEEKWTQLEANEDIELYFDGMGHYYSIPLANVSGNGLQGWFDLKIRLTDAAGNWQEQVICPAFRIDELAYSSVATIRGANATELARYTLDGRRINAGQPGINIIRMSDGTMRKELVK